MAFVLHPIKLEVDRSVPVPPDFEEFDLMYENRAAQMKSTEASDEANAFNFTIEE
jgi:hypothetical protein